MRVKKYSINQFKKIYVFQRCQKTMDKNQISHRKHKNVWVMHLNKTIDFERRCGVNATVKTLKLNRLRHILINIKY